MLGLNSTNTEEAMMNYLQSPPQDAVDSPGDFLVGSKAAQMDLHPGQGLLNPLAALSCLLGTYWQCLGPWFQALVLSLPVKQTGRVIGSVRSSSNGYIRHDIFHVLVK